MIIIRAESSSGLGTLFSGSRQSGARRRKIANVRFILDRSGAMAGGDLDWSRSFDDRMHKIHMQKPRRMACQISFVAVVLLM